MRSRARQPAITGFPADRTALLVIDPVNDFLSEGGAAWDLTESTVKKNDVVGSLRRVIDGAHEHGVIVLTGRYRIALAEALRDRSAYRELNARPAVAA